MKNLIVQNRRHYGQKTEMIIITKDTWTDTCLCGHKLTSSPLWREFEWKTKMNIFKTPLVIMRYSNTPELCWRKCWKFGDHTPILWNSPELYQ